MLTTPADELQTRCTQHLDGTSENWKHNLMRISWLIRERHDNNVFGCVVNEYVKSNREARLLSFLETTLAALAADPNAVIRVPDFLQTRNIVF